MTYDYYKGIQVAIIGVIDDPSSWSYIEFKCLKVPRYDFGLSPKYSNSNEDWIKQLLLVHQHNLEIKIAALEEIQRSNFGYGHLSWYNLSIKSAGEKITEEEYNKLKDKKDEH